MQANTKNVPSALGYTPDGRVINPLSRSSQNAKMLARKQNAVVASTPIHPFSPVNRPSSNQNTPLPTVRAGTQQKYYQKALAQQYAVKRFLRTFSKNTIITMVLAIVMHIAFAYYCMPQITPCIIKYEIIQTIIMWLTLIAGIGTTYYKLHSYHPLDPSAGECFIAILFGCLGSLGAIAASVIAIVIVYITLYLLAGLFVMLLMLGLASSYS